MCIRRPTLELYFHRTADPRDVYHQTLLRLGWRSGGAVDEQLSFPPRQGRLQGNLAHEPQECETRAGYLVVGLFSTGLLDDYIIDPVPPHKALELSRGENR